MYVANEMGPVVYFWHQLSGLWQSALEDGKHLDVVEDYFFDFGVVCWSAINFRNIRWGSGIQSGAPQAESA